MVPVQWWQLQKSRATKYRLNVSRLHWNVSLARIFVTSNQNGLISEAKLTIFYSVQKIHKSKSGYLLLKSLYTTQVIRGTGIVLKQQCFLEYELFHGGQCWYSVNQNKPVLFCHLSVIYSLLYPATVRNIPEVCKKHPNSWSSFFFFFNIIGPHLIIHLVKDPTWNNMGVFWQKLFLFIFYPKGHLASLTFVVSQILLWQSGKSNKEG